MIPVGVLLGALVGDLDGEAVGELVGAVVGDVEGEAVGELVGVPVVGDGVGESVDGEAVGKLVGAAVGAIDGEAVGGEVGHSEPMSVPPSADEHIEEYALGVIPAGVSPHKPGLLQMYMELRLVRSSISQGKVPISWLD